MSVGTCRLHQLVGFVGRLRDARTQGRGRARGCTRGRAHVHHDRSRCTRDDTRTRGRFPVTLRERFQLRLTLPQPRVGASARKQLGMRSILHEFSLFKDVNLISMLDGRQTMRDHDNRVAARKLARGRDDSGLAFGIDVARCLVEDVDGRVVQQGPGERQALALAARKVRALCRDLHVKPARLARKARQPALREGFPQLVVARIGLGEQQVRSQRSLEHVA